MKESMLEADTLTVGYGRVRVLDRVSVSASMGSLVGLVGPNGAGKTTLIRVLGGLLVPDSGKVFLEGERLDQLSHNSRARRLGYLSQDRNVYWPVTVERLVSLGRLPHRGLWDSLSEEDAEAIEAALISADVADLKHRTVTALSGGELARVLLARVLAGGPKILLADEPVSGLDPEQSLQVLEVLRNLVRAGCLVIIVIHDLTLASRFCDRLILLKQGQLIADGSPKEVLSPAHLASVYGIDAATVIHGREQAVLPWARTLHLNS